MSDPQRLLRSSAMVILVLGLNKITGFVKLLLMTSHFGAGVEADAFTAANQLPELFGAMLAGGALAAAIIPVYTAYRLRGEERDARSLANTVLTLTVLVMGGIGALSAWQAGPLARYVLVPDFAPAQQQLTAGLMAILLLAMTIFGVGSIFSSLLNAHHHFFFPAFATVVLDLGQIIGLYFLAPRWGIYGVAWGSVIGALLALGVQAPAFFRRRIATHPQLAWRLAGLHELARLMGPRVITLGIVQAVDLVLIRLASPLSAGSIAAYYYALLIMVYMPKSLFGLAITTVVFPTLAEQYNSGDHIGLRRTVTQALTAAWALVTPGAVGLLALGPVAVAFLLQRGAFDERATLLVYTLLVIFALRLVAETTQDILVLPFYARHNTQIPMWVSLGWMVVNVGLSFALVGHFGIHGLAWASTIAVVVATFALYLLNRWQRGGFGGWDIVWDFSRVLLASAGMAGAVILLRGREMNVLPYLVMAIGGGGLVYVILLVLLWGRSGGKGHWGIVAALKERMVNSEQ